MRLIDADALQRKICGAKCGCEYEDCGNDGDCEFAHFIFWAPTVDAEPVVRCKDCFYSEPLSDYMKKQYGDNVVRCNHPHFGLNLMRKELFCCFGERKDG